MTRLGSLVAVAFVVPLALLLAVGGASAGGLRALEAADRDVDESRAVLDALDQLLSSLTDAEAAGRGFSLAGEEAFLEPLAAAGPALDEARARLRRLRPGEPVRALEAAVDARLARTRALIATRRAGGLEEAAAEVRSGEGKALMDDVRRRVAALEADERARLGPLRDESRRAAERARRTVWWGTALAFLAAFLAGALVVRRLTRSLRTLTRGAEAVGKGELQGTVDVATKDELGQLAAAFNDMTGRLRAARAAEADARAKLEATARELREQKAIMERFFAQSTDLLYIGDRVAQGARFNPAWTSTLGHTEAELRATPLFDFVHPDDLERTRRENERIVAGGTTNTFENRYRTKDGGWRWLQWSASFDPELGIACAVARDVTERREREETLLQQSEELRTQAEELRAQGEELRAQGAALAAHQRELERKNAELERASRLKSEFLANMSHELRTPLNAVIGFSELLLDEARAALGPTNARYVEDIHASGRHLLSIIDELLDLARIEAGKLDLRVEPLDAAAAAGEAASLVESAARAKEIEVVTTGAAPPVLADAGRLRQVLLNLLSNALKFSPRGARVEVRVEPAGAAVRLSVRDTGPGMAPELVARLFQPFVQGEGPLSKRHEGTGLGLAITKRLVEAQGGTIAVRSAPGEGSTFEVTLPAAAADRPDGGPVVLVVAAPSRAAVLTRWLAEAGFTTLEATPADAVAVAERLRPAAIVIEMTFDPDDGARLLSRLRAVDALRATPALLATVGEAGPGFVGSLDTFVKPLATSAERDELVARVARLVEPRPERPPRILIIDDDPSVGAVLGPVLEAAGHRVTAVPTGEAGLDEARRHPPALAIVDLALPDLSGFEVIERLSADERTRAVPVVVLTALDLSDAQRARLRAGGRAVAEKGTFTREELLATVRRAVAGPAAAAAAGDGPTVLVVDDHDLNRELARSFLARRGYRVLCAAGGEEALALVRSDRPALVLMDLAMPGKDGFVTTAELKADPATRDIPVVALTALAMRADEERARAAGFADYLTKPIERKALEEAVARLLARPSSS